MHRVIYPLGFGAFAAASLAASMAEGPAWFGEAVYQGCAFVAATSAVLWLVSEVLLRLANDRRWLKTLLSFVAVGAVAGPALYLLPAAMFGAPKAQLDTWHLLSLFAVLYQGEAVVLSIVVGVLVLLILARVRRSHAKHA